MDQSKNGTKKTIGIDQVSTFQVKISLAVEIAANEEEIFGEKLHVLLHKTYSSLWAVSKAEVVSGTRSVPLQHAVDSCRLDILQNSSTIFETVRASVDALVEQIKSGRIPVRATLQQQ